MAGRITPGPNASGLNDLFYASFVTAADGKPALAIVNTDGSTVGTGGGTSAVNLTQVGGSAVTIGQAAMAASLPVVIASNQSSVPVSNFPATVTLNKGASDASTLRVSLGDGSQTVGAISNTAFTANAGTNLNTSALALESGGNLASIVTNQTNGSQQVKVTGGLMPAGTALNTFSVHLTTNTTTTPTSSTAYISAIAISNEVAGTTSSITIQDKQGTPLKLVNGLATTALTTAPTIITFNTPVKMVSGIDIITAGAAAATVDVWVNYYQ